MCSGFFCERFVLVTAEKNLDGRQKIFLERLAIDVPIVTGSSGTAILRLGHVQKFCQKF